MTSVFAGSQFRQTSNLWIWVPWLQSATMPSRMPGTQVKNIHLDKATLRLILTSGNGPSVGPSVQHVDVCVILPPFCGFIVSGKLLKQLGAFRAACRNPKNRIAIRSNAWIWRARFWSRLLQSRSLSGRHVSTSFLDPVSGP